MKILIISPFFPSEKSFHGGGHFLFEMIEHLGRRHQIGLVAFVNEKDPEDSFDQMKKRCGPIRTVRRDIFHLERRRRLANLFSPFPSWVLHTSSDKLRVSIEELLESFSPDIVQVEFLAMAHYVKWIRHPSVVLDIHEAFGRAWVQKALENGERGKVPYLLWDYWKMARFERKCLHRFKAVLTFSDEDQRYLLSRNKKACVNVWTRAMKVGPEPQFHASPEKEQEHLLFVGSFHHTPNIDAIGFFCEEIFPKILAERGTVILDIVGANPPDSVKRYQGPHVNVHGYVENLDPYYKNADVVVVPVRFGGGIRTKLLEAFARGRPAVATVAGAEGIDCTDGVHLFIASNPEVFVNRVLRLLADPVQRGAMGRKARKLVEERYNWPRSVRQLETHYENVLQGASG